MRLFRISSQRRRLRTALASGWLAAGLAGLGLVTFGGASAQAERPSTVFSPSYGASPQSGQPLSWTNATCNGCHTPSATFSHPVNKIPTMRVPSSLPLQNGKITCVTCHDDSSSALHAQARVTHDPMLRADATSASLCVQCHTESFTRSRDAHAMAAGRAHKWEEAGLATRRVSSARGRPGIDLESQRCLECHDGSMATKVGHQRTGDLFEFGADQEHPIGVEYRPKRGRDAVPLKPMATLDKRVRLMDGTVGCGSCHSLYSDQPKLLVMSNARSALCLSCHDY